MRKRLGCDGLLIVVTGGMLALWSGILLLSPPKARSETENRFLQTLSVPSLEEVWDGSFSRELSAYCTDQFPLRTLWILGKGAGERLLGKGENNGILFGRNGFLIPKGEYSSLEIAEKNLAALSRFSEGREGTLTALILPRHVDLLEDELPSGYSSLRSSLLAERLREEEGILFPDGEWQGCANHLFRTDHHRTAEGAYAVYAYLGEKIGYDPLSREAFSWECVSTSFLGSSHSRNGGIADGADEIILLRYEGDTEYEICDLGTGEVTSSFYDFSALERKNQYEIFLGGNKAALRVTCSDRERPRLLLIKDSFANNLIPLLALHFDLTVLDLRYGIPSGISPSDYDRILVLEGADTLATDSSLGRLSFLSP